METNNTITEDEMLENSFPLDDSKNFTPPEREDKGLEDANHFFNSKKQTFSGINAGKYIDNEDFLTYARWVAWQKEKDKVVIDKLKSSLVKVVNWHKAHEQISFMDELDLKEADELLQSLKQIK